MLQWRRLILELLATALAPEVCAACDAPVAVMTAFCPACARTLVPAPPDPMVLAPFLYGGALAQAITRFKYERRYELARPLSAVLARGVSSLGASPPDLVVPVPLHGNRLAQRGFNQAALIARPIARLLGCAFWARALTRVRDTTQQATLDREARMYNLTGAFEVRSPEDVAGKRILLVDDVRTTGATLRSCRDALTAAGSVEVVSAVLARV